MKKEIQKNNIQAVVLAIYANDGRKLEIPLEVWQVDVICQILGLSVDTSNLVDYQMRSKERVDESMEMYHKVIRSLNSKEQSHTKE